MSFLVTTPVFIDTGTSTPPTFTTLSLLYLSEFLNNESLTLTVPNFVMITSSLKKPPTPSAPGFKPKAAFLA